jgi:hypothetical protein
MPPSFATVPVSGSANEFDGTAVELDAFRTRVGYSHLEGSRGEHDRAVSCIHAQQVGACVDARGRPGARPLPL